ncbi:MBOAT family O-acyltransferase [Saccharicrinis sp. GN24d3]|uniref:MBOAT family O-acyltransferase n=1 Tax=Saccharicrinis sp. GN24d3 TaxID=3458416 RepID=UPI0040358E86
MMDKTEDDEKKKKLMIINIILILMPLLFYKYFMVINNDMIAWLDGQNIRWPLPEMKFLLPIGISYYTFMCIGYTIDIYNEEIEAEKNIGIVALFVSFFPLILSGPIERAGNLFPQFRNFKAIDFEDLKGGMKMMLWGYFMKLVVADRIGIYVDVVYGNIAGSNGGSLLVASILYPFQVYADLGGYTLLAMGVAKILGIKVVPNFKRPFFATSMAEFWRRWHMSLITWLTDYLYTPLSFSYRKYGIWGTVLALEITFLISGIWHVASWTMVVWGLMQGTFLSIEALHKVKRGAFEKKYNLNSKSLYLLFCMVVTFFLFAVSEVFGRAETVSDSWTVLKKIVVDQGTPYLDLTTLTYSVIGIVILLLKDFKDEFIEIKISIFNNNSLLLRYAAYLGVIFTIILFGVFDGNSFIYFQF